MKKVIVTGGAGFIGSHLCEILINDGKYHVTSIDNYSSGNQKNHIKGVNYIDGETINIDELISFKPDILYHLGEYSRVESSFNNIEKVYSSNKMGTFKIIEFCKRMGCKLVYAGSSTKFGDGGLGRDQSPYAWTKATNTELVINYGRWYSLNYAITYFYNAYGPREIESGEYATLIGIFKRKMINNEKLQVVAPGIQRRNFTHVKDIVSGLLIVGEKGYGDYYGIGSDISYSINEVANMFGGEVEMLPERPGNRMMAEVKFEKIKALGWTSKYNLPEYIRNLKNSNGMRLK
jgi:UDP-glucose 4-epimerase